MKKPNSIFNTEFDSLWDYYYPIIFRGLDVPQEEEVAFINFLRLQKQISDCQYYLDKDGIMYESTDKFGKTLLKPNPSHKIQADCLRMLIAYYNRYGITQYDKLTNEKRYGDIIEGDLNEFNFDD